MARRDAKTVLIADDDHDLVSVLSMRCRRMGLKVLAAFDAFTALSLVRSKMPDLVCLDIGMPAGNGLSVCEMMTSDATFRDTPVIVLTGRSDPHTIRRCHSMCAYYVEKSTDTWTRLEPLIRELLEIPVALPAATTQKSDAEADEEVKPVPPPVFPSLSTFYGEDATGKALATSDASVAEPAVSRDPPERPGVSHPDLVDLGTDATGSSEAESKAACSRPERETCAAEPTREQAPSPKLLTECSRIPSSGEVSDEADVREQPSMLVSEAEPEAVVETEGSAEPSSMWRQLAQVVGRVVGRNPEEPGKNSDGPVATESGSQTNGSRDEAASPIWHDCVTLSVDSTLPVESSPNDLLASAQEPQQNPLPHDPEQESDADRWVGRAHEAVPPGELDQVWSLAGNGVGASRSARVSSGQAAKAVRAERHKKPADAKKSGAQQEKTLLIADDDCDLVQMLVLRCEQLGLRVFRSPDAMHALLGAHRVQPDLVILDVNMPGGNGLSVCEMMAGDPTLAKIPVIVMTGDANEEIPRRCQALHAQFLQKGPGLWERLEALIRKSLGMPPAVPPKAATSTLAPAPEAKQQPRILCIDDDPEISKILKLRLEPYGVDVLRAFKGMQGYWTALDMRPDLIILDMVMPDGGGNYILGRLRAHPLTEKTPVVMLTGVNTPGTRRQMFGLGVDAYLTKPLDFNALIEHVGQYVTLRDRVGAAASQ
jgi:CheY-like chemotaxis protein